jgi:hypothetical protein
MLRYQCVPKSKELFKEKMLMFLPVKVYGFLGLNAGVDYQ